MSLFPSSGIERMPLADAPAGVARFRLPPTSPCFDGHFDAAPILPGVIEIALAFEACADVAAGGRLQELRDVRFTRTLQPGDEVDVTVVPGAVDGTRRFEIRCGGRTAASGVFVFGPEGAA